jgi:transposase
MVEMGIIPEYKGVLVHDHWKPYLGYDCEHGLCNAHHLWELQWVIDFKQHKWASLLKKFLTKLNDEVDEYGGVLPEDIQKRRVKRYRE